MRKFDVSIEFAHLYADQHFSEAQQLGLAIAQRETQLLSSSRLSVTTLIMIDDLHAAKTITDSRCLERELRKHCARVDSILLESELVPVALELVADLPPSLTWKECFRREGKQVWFLRTAIGAIPILVQKNDRLLPTCAMLSATLLLVRLGALVNTELVPHATRVITIVEERYHAVEERALSIISMTSYHHLLERISTIAFHVKNDRLLIAA